MRNMWTEIKEKKPIKSEIEVINMWQNKKKTEQNQRRTIHILHKGEMLGKNADKINMISNWEYSNNILSIMKERNMT